jgi:hypothetical protein
MATKRADEVKVGERVEFIAPRIPTPNAGSEVLQVVGGGVVANPRSVAARSHVREVETEPDGRITLHTEAKVLKTFAPDARVAIT